jgi:hypothetical protein
MMIVAFGASDGGFWNVSLNRNTGVVSAAYIDADLEANDSGISSETFLFLPGACSLSNFDQ